MESSFSAISSYVMVLAVGTVALLILFVRQQRTERDLPMWFMSGVGGILLGGALSAAVLQGMGYTVVVAPKSGEAGASDAIVDNPPAPGGMGGMGGGGGRGGGGGMMGGGGGMGGGMMGGGGGMGEKRSQATGPIVKIVTAEGKLMKESTDLLTDYKKLSGI